MTTGAATFISILAVGSAFAFVLRSAARTSHFEAMVLFALFVTIALGCVTPQQSAIKRLEYVVQSFLLFVVIAVGIAWLMYPFSR